MGRVVLARRERPIIVEPIGNGLLGFTLRYAHEVRKPTEYFAEIPKLTLDDELLEVAERIIEMKTGEFDPAFLEDRYRTVLASMLREKQVDLACESGGADAIPAECHRFDGGPQAEPFQGADLDTHSRAAASGRRRGQGLAGQADQGASAQIRLD